jgi:hypothetical protein
VHVGANGCQAELRNLLVIGEFPLTPIPCLEEGEIGLHSDVEHRRLAQVHAHLGNCRASRPSEIPYPTLIEPCIQG